MRLYLLPGLCLLAALLLGGCSRVGLVYNNLGVIVGFEAGRMLDLDRSQKQLFDTGFQSLWDWHRHTQLPLYAQDLHGLAAALEQPLTPEQVLDYLRRAEAHGEVLTRQAIGPVATLLASLREEQVRHLDQRLRERMQRAAGEERASDAEWVEQAYRNARKSLEKWTGSASPEQRAQLRAWAEHRLQWRPAAQEDSPDAFLAVVNQLLAQRREADFPQRLETFLFGQQQDAEDRRQADAQRAEGAAFLAQMSQGLSPAQRAHLQRRLRGYARELEKLAAR